MTSAQDFRGALLRGVCELLRTPERIKVKTYRAEADLLARLANWLEERHPSNSRSVVFNAIIMVVCSYRLEDAKEKLRQMQMRPVF